MPKAEGFLSAITQVQKSILVLARFIHRIHQTSCKSHSQKRRELLLYYHCIYMTKYPNQKCWCWWYTEVTWLEYTCLRQSILDKNEESCSRGQVKSAAQNVNELADGHVSRGKVSVIQDIIDQRYMLIIIGVLTIKCICMYHACISYWVLGIKETNINIWMMVTKTTLNLKGKHNPRLLTIPVWCFWWVSFAYATNCDLHSKEVYELTFSFPSEEDCSSHTFPQLPTVNMNIKDLNTELGPKIQKNNLRGLDQGIWPPCPVILQSFDLKKTISKDLHISLSPIPKTITNKRSKDLFEESQHTKCKLVLECFCSTHRCLSLFLSDSVRVGTSLTLWDRSKERWRRRKECRKRNATADQMIRLLGFIFSFAFYRIFFGPNIWVQPGEAHQNA